jgi:putative inorganic carbon (hco3(-)) transporter
VAIGGRNLRSFYATLAFFIAIGMALAILGLLTLRWSSMKIPLLEPLLLHIPHLFISLPGATDGVSPNQLAGMLLWLLPVTFATCFLPLLPGVSMDWWERPLLLLLAVFVAVSMGIIFALTQSRSALLGFLFALPLVALIPLWRFRKPLLGLMLIVTLVGMVLFFQNDNDQAAAIFIDRLSSHLVSDMGSTVDNFEARVAIWAHSIAAIHDFPWSGIGLGTLRQIAPQLYPFFTIRQDEQVPHAHNHLLQTALDVGLPGLVAYLSLWLGAAVMLRQVWRRATAAGSRLLVLAFAGALLAYFIFGLADTVALGAKPGFLFWFLFGLITAYYRTIVPAIRE